MSTYDYNLLAARFAALAPEPLAGNWDDVLDRAGARNVGRPLGPFRADQGRRRRLFVVLAAVALVVVATASAFAVRAFVIDKGIVGLPPVGATPSTPENGVLEMDYTVSGRETRSRTWVYADGRLIRLGTPPRRGFLEQRLTREGVKLLRSEILSAGGFGHAQPPPGSTLLENFGPSYPGSPIQVRKGDRLVPLRWVRDLKHLEARLANPGSWLPASAWKQPKIRAYVPSRFAVCAGVVVLRDLDKPAQGRFVQMRPARIVALLPAAAQNALRGRDWTRGFPPPQAPTSSGYYPRYPSCFAVTTNEARSLAKALDAAGPATVRKGGRLRLHYAFDAPGPSRQVQIGFDPLLPHGELALGQFP
jgi:hypothetical protein